jgi:4-amino-4-deoxy-L-arabinose transferase
MRPFIIPDETRYAEIPREMLASGDWVVPKLDSLRYFEKPVMGYWLNAISMSIFGQNEFAARLPTALSAGLSALLLFLLIKKSGKDDEFAIGSVIIFLLCMEIYFVGTFNVLDTMLAFFLTGGLVSFYLAVQDERQLQKNLYLAAFGIFCGMAFLLKGFLAFAVPVLVIVPFMIWERKWLKLFTYCWVPMLFAVLVALPWSIMVHLREGDFWRYFFWEEHVRRFLSMGTLGKILSPEMLDRFVTVGTSQHHPAPFWYFIPVLLGGAMPFSLLLPAMVSGLKDDKKQFLKDKLFRYCLCWVVVPFVFFSISKGKLATYILPLFPAVAFLFMYGIRSYFEFGGKKIFNVTVKIFAILLIIGGVGFAIFQFGGILKSGGMLDLEKRHGASLEDWKCFIWILGLGVWAVFLYFAAKATGRKEKLRYFCYGPLMLMFCWHFTVPELVLNGKAPGQFLLKHQKRITPETIIFSYKNTVRAVCWYYKRSDINLFLSDGEFEYGIKCEDSKHRIQRTIEDFARFVKANKGKQIVLFLKTKLYEKYYRGHLENEGAIPRYEDSYGEFTIVEY